MAVPQQTKDDKAELEKGFRESLKDVLAVIDRLGPHCETFADLLAIVQRGVDDDAQLRFLMSLVTAPSPKR